jgi:hypothetical protein
MRIMPSELNKLSTRGRDQGKRQGRNIASCHQSRGRQKQQPKHRRKRRAANNTRYPAQRRRRNRVRGKLPNHQRRRNVLRRKLPARMTPFDASWVTFQSTPSHGPWRKRRHHQSPGISPHQYQQVDCSKLHDKLRPRDRQHDSTLPSFETLEYPVHRRRRFLLRRVRQTVVF